VGRLRTSAALAAAMAALILAVVLLAPACGAGGASTTSSQTAPGGAVQISMKNIAFSPADVTIKVGQTVTWTNLDGAQHDVVANDGAFKSDLLDTGQTFSFTFPKAGVFNFYCSIHPQMKGTITVRP
jgi:plastocyanin